VNIRKEKREERILLSLKRLDFLTREQIQKLHQLGKTRNAQRVLNEMSEYLSYFLEDRKKVYYLNKAGRERVNSTKVRKKTAKVTHYLMRNDLFIHLGKSSSWKNEVKIEIPDSKVSIVSDAIFYSNRMHHFVEIDYKQHMSTNLSKIKKYEKLATYNPEFVVVWLTTTPYRKKRLETMCKDLKVQVYLWDDIK
jgi:hypothetical protein